MNNGRGLAEIIDELGQVIHQYDQIRYGDDITYLSPPPATKHSIHAFERSRGIRFPLTYHNFLLLHNGWEHYAYGYTLIGASGEHTEAALRDIAQTVDIVKDEWEQIYGEPTADKIRQFQAVGDNVNLLEANWTPYVPSKIHIGTDFNGGLIFFDPERTGSDGEMEVFCWNTDGGTRAHYANFVEMLTADLANLKAEIKAEGTNKKTPPYTKSD